MAKVNMVKKNIKNNSLKKDRNILNISLIFFIHSKNIKVFKIKKPD